MWLIDVVLYTVEYKFRRAWSLDSFTLKYSLGSAWSFCSLFFFLIDIIDNWYQWRRKLNFLIYYVYKIFNWNFQRCHADATYKLIWQGFRVLVRGITDQNLKFHPLRLTFSSNEQKEDFKLMFQGLMDKIKEIFEISSLFLNFLLLESKSIGDCDAKRVCQILLHCQNTLSNYEKLDWMLQWVKRSKISTT